MFDRNTLADLIVIALSIYRKRDVLAFDPDAQDDAIRRLNEYCILSSAAIASILAVSHYRVRRATAGMPVPVARGHLNPSHLTMLLHGLSNGDIPARWLDQMIDEGTGISTISDLTAIPESTLYRKRGN